MGRGSGAEVNEILYGDTPAREAAIPADPVFNIFNTLNGTEYVGFSLLHKAVVKEFDKTPQAFPRGYSYTNAINWALRQNWVRMEGGGHVYVVNITD